ncbi:MAG: GGDEF domain-containing protein [Alphaproteobacteria bacterium]|nr:GGDEF domain-containing protein [Alphaproteobacteria bacterium]
MTVETLNKQPATQQSEAGVLSPEIRSWLEEASTLLHAANREDGDGNAAVALSLAIAEAQKIINDQQERIAALEELSHTDELTGVQNRRGFALEIDRQIMDAARRGRSGAIIFVDLDGFKGINDTHGHAAGDAVLKSVAEFLMDMVRGGDAVGRLGGDEFAVMLAGVDPKKAVRRAHQIHRKLEAIDVTWNGATLPVRASMGTVSFDGSSVAADIMNAADQAMYDAKRSRKSAA